MATRRYRSRRRSPRAEKVADPDRKRRFVQEAEAASALSHPNIIHVYDIEQADGTDFIAMEYIEGGTPAPCIPRRGIQLGEALKYAIQFANALARAHGKGIVHRGLRPSNVMVDEHGLVRVLDSCPPQDSIRMPKRPFCWLSWHILTISMPGANLLKSLQ
jgi:serine/threonine protein kinase